MTSPLVISKDIDIIVPTADRTDSLTNVHSDVGAAKWGFKRALVFAVSVYGWSVPLIIEALGEEWVKDGWVDVRFRKPIYQGDKVTSIVTREGDQATLQVMRDGNDLVLAAELGLGTGRWVRDFYRSPLRPVDTLQSPPPLLTLENAPVGQPLPTVRFLPGDRTGPEGTEPITVAGRRVRNPAQIASYLSGYGRALYSYKEGTSLDARRHVQHLDFIDPDEPLTISGFMPSVFERHGHHFVEYDGTVYGGDGRAVALVRHTVVFSVAEKKA